jgi:hypothetical protein
MRFYSFYLKPNAKEPLEHMLVVPEGFAFLAMLMPLLWALYYRVWSMAAVCLLVEGMLWGWFLQSTAQDSLFISLLNLGWSVWMGMIAQDWRSRDAQRRGYQLQDVASGKHELEAQRRFLDRFLTPGRVVENA